MYLSKRHIKEAMDTNDVKRTALALLKIYKFMFHRVPKDKQQEFMSRLRGKILKLSPMQISSKKIKPTSSLGQAVGFTKNLLYGHNPVFVQKVLIQLAYFLNRGQ